MEKVVGAADMPARDVRERFADTPRLRMQYAEWAGDAPTILLVHPNRTSHRVWDFMVASSGLAQRFVAPALRGHAGSDAPAGPCRLEDHRDDLIALIDALDLAPLVLVGQATGATLALMIATLRPHSVKGVVAAQPAVGIASAVNEMVRTQVVEQTRMTDRDAARRALPFAERWTPDVTEHYLDHALATLPDGGVTWRHDPEIVKSTEAELMRKLGDEIRYPGPTLVFGGAQSTVLPQAMFASVAALLPDARLTALHAADHRLCQDNPAGFARLVDEFVHALGIGSGDGG